MEPIAQSFAVDQLLSNVSWLRALAVRLVRDEATAEDLTHETLVAALEHQPATNRSLRPWLARVLRNSLSKRTRGSAARAAREDSVARDEILPSSEDLLMRGEMQSRLVAEVLKLDDPYRSLVLLRFYEGLEPSEIARKRDQSAGSVRGQLSRAVGILRERLDASDAESQLDWRGALLQDYATRAAIGEHSTRARARPDLVHHRQPKNRIATCATSVTADAIGVRCTS